MTGVWDSPLHKSELRESISAFTGGTRPETGYSLLSVH